MQNNRSTILVIVVGFTLLGLLSHKTGLIWTGCCVGILALASSIIEHWIVWVWNKIAHILGTINSKLLLTLTFFLILVPLSLLKKLFSKTDSLKLKQPTDTMWTIRDHQYTKEDLQETF